MREPWNTTISLIPCSGDDCKSSSDWASFAGQILRCCPLCGCDSVISNGWRPKQAHDDRHDWIRYRRGECQICGVTISFLPAFSLPYTHYSLIARSEALRRRFAEGSSWEDAAPPLKDAERVPAPSTLRRWCRDLDSLCPAFSFLRRAVQIMAQDRCDSSVFSSRYLSWPMLYPCLRVVWPWPLRF